MPNIINSLREFICFNQKHTIKYEYIISQNHKELKDYYYSQRYDEKKLKEKYESFLLESYGDLLDIINSNKVYIENIFKSLGKEEVPRINIKTIHHDSVLNIYSSTNLSNFYLTKIKDNSGFNDIMFNNKISYLENNIPEKFKESRYKNPRLMESEKNNYIEGLQEWKDCWKTLNNTNDSKVEYYSSTLILPMSIRNDSKDTENKKFYNHFFKDVHQHKNSRTIWGFLCFDSNQINYFKNKNNDDFTEVGYILADMLSLYLMYFHNHISGSKTIQDIQDTIENN